MGILSILFSEEIFYKVDNRMKKNLDHRIAASILWQYCEESYTKQGAILHICFL